MVIAVRHDEAGALARPARRDHQDMRGVRVADDGSVHFSENEAAPPGQAPLCGVEQRTELRVAFVLCWTVDLERNRQDKCDRPDEGQRVAATFQGFLLRGRILNSGPKMARPEQRGLPTKGRE